MRGKHTGLSEEEVLLAFAVEPIHDRETLEHYLGEYPEHVNALVDCSIELMVDATRGDEVALTSEAVVDQAWQIFQTTVGQRGATSSKPDTDLDLDDVAATSPKAKAELEELRSENADGRNQGSKVRAVHLLGAFP